MINSNVTTLTLNGAETAVEFSAGYPYFQITNKSDSDMYVSLKPEISPETDGTYTIAAGETARIGDGYRFDTFYIMGTGKAYIRGEQTAFPTSFKQGTKGGDVPQIVTSTTIDSASTNATVPTSKAVYDFSKGYTDTEIANLINGAPETLDTLNEIATAMQDNQDVVEALDSAIGQKADKTEVTALENDINSKLDKKANTTDIPTSLPANGGNADTVNNHTVNSDVPSDAKFTDTTYTLPAATSSALGGVKSGGNIDVDPEGNVSVKYANVASRLYEWRNQDPGTTLNRRCKIASIKLTNAWADYHAVICTNECASNGGNAILSWDCATGNTVTTLNNNSIHYIGGSGDLIRLYKNTFYTEAVAEDDGILFTLWCEPKKAYYSFTFTLLNEAKVGVDYSLTRYDKSEYTTETLTGHVNQYSENDWYGNASTASKLTTSAGADNQPVYFVDGKPVSMPHTIAKSVPSDAKFTDTTYSNATQSASGLMSAADKVKLDGLTAGGGNYYSQRKLLYEGSFSSGTPSSKNSLSEQLTNYDEITVAVNFEVTSTTNYLPRFSMLTVDAKYLKELIDNSTATNKLGYKVALYIPTPITGSVKTGMVQCMFLDYETFVMGFPQNTSGTSYFYVYGIKY